MNGIYDKPKETVVNDVPTSPAQAVIASMTRRVTALDWVAKLVEERGQELAESFLAAARKGGWLAADALMNRIYRSLRRQR
jgi:hypothetical protein